MSILLVESVIRVEPILSNSSDMEFNSLVVYFLLLFADGRKTLAWISYRDPIIAASCTGQPWRRAIRRPSRLSGT